jgi:hypothetical protein
MSFSLHSGEYDILFDIGRKAFIASELRRRNVSSVAELDTCDENHYNLLQREGRLLVVTPQNSDEFSESSRIAFSRDTPSAGAHAIENQHAPELVAPLPAISVQAEGTGDQERTCFCLCNEEKTEDKQCVVPLPNLSFKISNQAFDKLLQEMDNRFCIDCDAVNPDWASIGFGTFLCLSCAGRHRSFGTHVTLVRSVTMDDWSQEQLSHLISGGNRLFKDYLSQELTGGISVQERYYNPKVTYYREILRSRIAGCVPEPYDEEKWKSDSPSKIEATSKKQPIWVPDSGIYIYLNDYCITEYLVII